MFILCLCLLFEEFPDLFVCGTMPLPKRMWIVNEPKFFAYLPKTCYVRMKNSSQKGNLIYQLIQSLDEKDCYASSSFVSLLKVWSLNLYFQFRKYITILCHSLCETQSWRLSLHAVRSVYSRQHLSEVAEHLLCLVCNGKRYEMTTKFNYDCVSFPLNTTFYGFNSNRVFPLLNFIIYMSKWNYVDGSKELFDRTS